ncbi:Piwi domain-containing protein [Zychaea mexicana]|uniref:Piwi domain-containing protein n=1 Tax=Zychaea mexicana TaxID=64656 RepID=UPI0022FF0C06|nr:Piwi domain-containing protein [Zychaea mexicana]KAI9489904.1 Piwi domain-containing protein [Zychaea mexicana]
MSSALTNFVLRPEHGKIGTPIKVRSNFFEIQSFNQGIIHHYDVTIGDGKVPPAVNRKVWQKFEMVEGQSMLRNVRPVFDGRKNVFSPKALHFSGPEQVGQFEVELSDGGGESSSASRRRVSGKFVIRIKKVGEVNMLELSNFLQRKSQQTPGCLTAIQALDVLIRHVPSMTFDTVVGRSFYTPQDLRVLPNGAEVWSGVYSSARPGAGNMFLNVDVCATAFYESGPLPGMVAKILGRRSIDELRRGITDRDRAKLERFLKSVQIQVKHRGDKKFKYKITRLTPTPAERTFFKNQDDEEKSVSQYFTEQYNMRLSYAFLPCIVVRKDMFLPMEVCEIVPGQRFMKKLDEKQTAEMIKFTCQKPDIRANKTRQGLTMLQCKPENPYLKQFGVKVNPDMAIVQARVLPPPQVMYSQGFTPNDGAWNMRGKKLAKGASLGSWSVVNFHVGLARPSIERFIRELTQAFINVGLDVVKRDPPIMINADPQGNIDRTMKEAWLQAGNAAKANPQLIVCILPVRNTQLYGEIKNISDTVLGTPTQCLQSKHINSARFDYCANVCLKVNMKLGGMNKYLPANLTPFLAQRPTIVFGADVTHPAPGDVNRPSIAAVTASMDARATNYSSEIRVQSSRTEIITDLSDMVKEQLKKFYKNCGQKPDRILFYRDGVSEGQFQAVLTEEVQRIHAACASLDKTYKPKVTFVVVKKRHHARFFPVSKQDTDRSGNCQPGTVIDTKIVHPFEFDFYLQSHQGIQGTSRPTHYHVLYDENKFTADALQELSYRLCYIYGRATRAVSMVPPVYYAHLLAFRARFHRHGVNWSDTGATSETVESEQQLASYARVKPELQKVMYFM